MLPKELFALCLGQGVLERIDDARQLKIEKSNERQQSLGQPKDAAQRYPHDGRCHLDLA